MKRYTATTSFLFRCMAGLLVWTLYAPGAMAQIPQEPDWTNVWPASPTTPVQVGDTMILGWTHSGQITTSYGLQDHIVLRSNYHLFNDAAVVDMDVKARLRVTLTTNPDHGDYKSIDDETELVYVDLEIGIRKDGISVTGLDPDLDATNADAWMASDAHRMELILDNVQVNTGSGYQTATELPLGMFFDLRIRWYNVRNVNLNIPPPNLGASYQGCAGDTEAQADELLVTWGTLAGMVEYQLEWTWVDDYSKIPSWNDWTQRPRTAIFYDLHNNATRITTPNTSYRIPLLYDRGWIVFRVRGVGRDPMEPEVPIYTVWAGADQDGDVEGPYPTYAKHVTGHQREKNWQATSSFAEEGKRKEVMTYADGTSRSRQVVTRNNSLMVPIIGESVYDAIGRPAVDILPVPMVTGDCDPLDNVDWAPIKYYPDFNMADNGGAAQTLDWHDIVPGTGPDGCEVEGPDLNNESGAEFYYSESYPNATDPIVPAPSFLPAADKRPYAQKEFTRDKTGRLRQQGGVGPDLQLGADHETRIYYGKPEQIQLDRLFGSEAGYAHHYQKTVQRDPNKQWSVTYTDIAGRTVATSLTCDAPPGMEPLPANEVELTTDLFNGLSNLSPALNQRRPDGPQLYFSTTIPVACGGDYIFDYRMSSILLTDDCWADTLGNDLCVHCVYELDILLTDECGVTTTLQQGIVGELNLGNEALMFECNMDPTSFEFSPDPVTVPLTEGEWTLTKVLRVHDPARDFYVERLIDPDYNTCVHDFDYFYDLLEGEVDLTDCTVDCADCYTALGTLQHFLLTNPESNEAEYYAYLTFCDEMCAEESWCQVAYRNMVTDMSRHGQYCEYTLDANQNVVVTDPTSVLYGGTGSERLLARPYWNNNSPAYRQIDENEVLWRQPWFKEPDGSTHEQYRDMNGDRTKVWLIELSPNVYDPPIIDPTHATPDGPLWYTYPEFLADVTDFVNIAWQPGFERSLVRFHPEYCYYQDCKSYGPMNTDPLNIVTSDDFDAKLRSCTTLTAAEALGWITMNGSLEVQSVNLWNVDPFVTPADDWAQDLQYKCDNFSEINGTMYNLGQIALSIVRCLGNIQGTDCANINTIIVGSTEGDAWWIRVRDMYFSRKYIVQKNRANEYVRTCECPGLNYCIGEESTSTWWNKMGAPYPYFWNWWGSNSYWNFLTNWLQQPRNLWCQVCSHYSYQYFDDKVRRFEEPSQIQGSDMSAADAAYQIYLTTGQCPLGSAWQQFLNEIITHERFLTTNDQDSLEHSGAWTAIQFALNDLQGGAPAIPGEIDAHLTGGNDLEIAIDENWDMSVECTVTLQEPTVGFDWNSIIYVANITEQMPVGHFRIGVYYMDADGVTQLEEIDGVMCEQYQLWPCNFPRTCEPNEFALHLESLMSMLAYGNHLESASVPLSTTQIPGGGSTMQAQIHPSISGLFAASPTFQWSYVPGGPSLILSNTAQAGVFLRLDDLTTEPDAQPVGYYLAQTASLLNITSNYENFFTVDLLDNNGVLVATLSGALFWEEGGVLTPLPAGECDLPDPVGCQTMGHVSYADLLAVLEERLTDPGVNLSQLDLAESPHITQSLLSSLVPDCDSTWTSGGVSCLLGSWNNGTDTWTLDDCLTLEFTGSWQVPIDAFGDAEFTGTPDQPSGAYHSFIVDLMVGGSVAGQLEVTTCMDLMPCEPCMPDSGAMSGEGEGQPIAARYGMSDEEMIEAGLVHEDLMWPKYAEYTTAVAGLNQRFGYIPSDSLYMDPLDYPSFRAKGFQHILGSYLKYIDGFQPVADKEDLLYQPSAFTVEYSGSVNVTEEYTSYQNAVADYNTRATALSKPTITAVADSTFKQLLAADVSRLYVNDLVERYPSNTPPQGLVQYIAQQGAPTDPCADIYTEQYLVAYAWLEAHNADSTTRCPGYAIYSPLVSYEDFLAANLCCSDTGMAVLAAYLELFYNDTLPCPGELPRLKLCPEDDEEAGQAKALIDDERECQRLYLLWLEMLDKYHQPSAYYAFTHIGLPNHYKSFEEFMAAGLCECVEEYLAYLETYLAWKLGQEPLPDVVTIEEFCNPTEDPCCLLFDAVLDALAAYDTSAYYYATHHALKTCDLRDCASFIAEGFCECAEAYIAYLQVYINWHPQIPMPQDKPLCIKEWCLGYDPTECEQLYTEYMQTLISLQPILQAYNAANNTNFQFQFADASLFTPNELCYCVEGYLAHLSVVFADLDAHRDELEAGRILMLIRWCEEPVPCDPVLYPVIGEINTTIDPDSGCIMDLLNTLHLNATTWYNQYLDTLTQDVTELYDSTCMQAFESFTMQFTDQEHHFTLYYYDQAGNLVRTVPPAGVALPTFTSSLDPDALRIADDRLNGTHTYFTGHRMASDHLYNSLGQPTRSAMPDQDDMKIWEPSLTSGLPAFLQVTDSWFKPGGQGYLSGYRDISGLTRGYVYGTADGGATWHRKTGLLGLDLHDVHFPSAGVGYSVGDQGSLLRTEDGGNNWDLRPTANLTHDIALRGVMFENDDDGVMVGSTGGDAWSGYTTDGGVSVTANTPADFQAFTGIGLDGSTYCATAIDDDDLNGAVLTGTGTSWSTTTGMRGRMASDHKAMATLGTNEVWLGGQRGVLLYSDDNGDEWRMVATGHKDDFWDLHFYTQSVAVAIMDSTDQFGTFHIGVLRASFDGGNTWVAKGKPHHDLNDFHAYDGSHLIAVGKDGQVVRVMMSTTNVVTTDIGTLMNGATVEHTSVWAGMDGAVLRLVVGSDDGTLRFCANAVPAAATWANTHTTGGDGILAIAAHADPGVQVNAVVVDDTGERFDAALLPVGPAQALTGVGTGYVPILAQPDADAAITAETTSDLEVLDLTSFPILVAPTIWPSTGSLADLQTMAFSGGTLVQAGLAGAIQNAPGSTWTDQSKKVQPLRLYGITDDGKVAVGEEGLVYHNDGSQWNAIPSPAFDDLLDAAMHNPYFVVCVGEGSTVFMLDLTNPMAAVTSHTLPISTTVLSIAVNNGSARTLGTPDGSILYAPTSGAAYTVLPFNGGAVNGLAPRPGSNDVMAVGGQSMVHRVMTTTRIAIPDVFTPRLNGIHFANGSDGYTVGDARIVRHTADGGTTWQAVPTSSAMANAALHDVYTTAPGNAVTVGDAIACSLDGVNVASIITGLSGKSLRGVAISPSGAGVIVGHNGGNGIYYQRDPGGSSWTSTAFGPRLNAVWSFPRYLDQDRFLLAGFGGNMIRTYWDEPTTQWLSHPNCTTLVDPVNALFFHDHVAGYAVGNDGEVARTNSIVTTPDFSTLAWDALQDDIDDGLAGQGTIGSIDLTTIGFSDRYHGFYAGTYAPDENFARIVNDESGLFSQRFWYDALGRIVLSQNSKQRAPLTAVTPQPQRFSYSLYDDLGRVVEAGEVTEDNTDIFDANGWKAQLGYEVGGVENPNVVEPNMLAAWVAGRTRREVTRTYYDEEVTAFGLPSNYEQRNLRLRVASTTFQEDGQATDYDHATHYSYDIHGNVDDLLQDHPQMAIDLANDIQDPMRWKRMKYRYDLISGNVLQVKYQEGDADQFYHKYEYDADNRITKVETSLDNTLYHTDAEYFYYPHGPLQRTELGEQKVQGMDYAYTLQGWLKGINSELLTPDNDMGLDGVVGSGLDNDLVGRDAYGLSLTYHGNDYRATDNARWDNATFHRPFAPQNFAWPDWHPLYNGNIATTVNSLEPFGVGGWQGTTNEVGQVLAGLYRYDQLNRLRQMRTRAGLVATSNDWTVLTPPTGQDADKYLSTYEYDANGNIDRATRFDQDGVIYDELLYRYQNDGALVRNRLYQVIDEEDDANLIVNETDDGFEDYPYQDDDITDQDDALLTINTANNYGYDELGNLIRDDLNEIGGVDWTVAGKVKAVTRPGGSPLEPLEFAYGADGQRTEKTIGTGGNLIREHYVWDAQGNVMAIYRHEPGGGNFTLKERALYGSNRLGRYVEEVEFIPPPTIPMTQAADDRRLQYEMIDHLGNVGTVVTGRLLIGNGAPHEAQVLSAQGYEPFGSLLPGRNYSSDSYRFGFNRAEKDDEVYGATGTSYDFGDRIYDPRAARWLSIDPYAHKYASISPYAFVGNSPIYALDPNGREILIVHNGRARKYTIGMKPGIFTARRVKESIAMLNDIAKVKGAAFEEVVTSDKTLELRTDAERVPADNTGDFWHFWSADNMTEPGAPNHIYVDPRMAGMELDADGNVISTSSPTSALSHEIGHFYYDVLHPEEKNQGTGTNHDQIVPEWETPVQQEMNNQGDNGMPRTTETEEKAVGGYNYKSTSPSSTEPDVSTPTGRKAAEKLK
ncbi:MAG: hypothetical protein KA175_01310 [Flavobacteriales bacterium]|nr:hypothetical protein [Flavobacteriales bacterium]MBP6696223.1 hypothetical protein [Flavobacteriales bacterium]